MRQKTVTPNFSNQGPGSINLVLQETFSIVIDPDTESFKVLKVLKVKIHRKTSMLDSLFCGTL